MQLDQIRVFNRHIKPLAAMKDGRSYSIPVGLSWLRADIVPFAKAQNPIMGSEDPYGPDFRSFLGVVAPEGEAQRDEIDPFDAEMIAVLEQSIERLDRSKLGPEAQKNIREMAAVFPRARTRQGIEQPSAGMMDPGKFD